MNKWILVRKNNRKQIMLELDVMCWMSVTVQHCHLWSGYRIWPSPCLILPCGPSGCSCLPEVLRCVLMVPYSCPCSSQLNYTESSAILVEHRCDITPLLIDSSKWEPCSPKMKARAFLVALEVYPVLWGIPCPSFLPSASVSAPASTLALPFGWDVPSPDAGFAYLLLLQVYRAHLLRLLWPCFYCPFAFIFPWQFSLLHILSILLTSLFLVSSH